MKETNSNKPRYVVCLKHGNKYSSDYVNKLYNMVKRNLTLNFNFVCFTENPAGIDKEIKIQPLPEVADLKGWWYKPMFFNPALGLNGTILFIDLDVVIFKNIDYLFNHKPGKFCIIRDFNRCRISNYDKFNSSVFRLESGQFPEVYTDFMKDYRSQSRRHYGDQDWLRYKIQKDFEYFPDEWIQSYKWEMRDRPRMIMDPTGGRNFATIGDPTIKPETSIAVFHGDPNPHKCKDPWVIDNWK